MLGILPGGGALLSFVAHDVENKVSSNSAEFGKGAVAAAGSCQRRRADVVHSDADAGHSLKRRHGIDRPVFLDRACFVGSRMF